MTHACLRLADCTVLVSPSRVSTILPSGEVVHGVAHDTVAYAQTAERLGYGDDVARLNRCHEVGHGIIAHLLGLPASPTFLRVAAGEHEATDLTRAEEDAVMSLERFALMVGVDLVERAQQLSQGLDNADAKIA